MASRKFSKEEMEQLRACAYVLDITPSLIHFSVEFKQLFWEELMAGKHPREIIRSFGIDPEILGSIRISGISGQIRKEAKSGKGFRDLDSYNKYLAGYTTPEGKIKYLEQQLAYK